MQDITPQLKLYLSYIRRVDYRGLNKAIIATFVIYHMVRNIGCICR
jgi:hypothetical protein